MNPQNNSSTLRIYGLVPDSIVDGPNLRYSIFVQGCPHGCPGCHNPESHDVDGGKIYDVDAIYDDIRSNELVHDVTFSGGEPFAQAAACSELARRLKDDGYGIWVFTGFIYEDLLERAKEDTGVSDFLDQIDVLVDGPFIESLKSIELDWKGSSNQRVIDMNRSRSEGRVVEWRRPEIEFKRPSNW